MSDPRQQQDEPGELDLDPETVGDLELSDDPAEDVRGGMSVACPTIACSNAYHACASDNACFMKP